MHRRTPLRMGPLRFRDPVLLCGVLYGLLLFDASGFLRTGLLAAFLHEWGHILVYCAQQRRIPVIEVTLTGFCMRLGRAELSPAQRFRLAAAGPAVNFALAGVWAVLLSRQATVRGSAFWAANLLTGAFNLLPVPPLDGSRLLEYLLPRRWLMTYYRYARAINTIFLFVLLFTDVFTNIIYYFTGYILDGMYTITAFIPELIV